MEKRRWIFAGDSGSEVESVTIAHVQDVLEHAYPNGLSVETIAELRYFREMFVSKVSVVAGLCGAPPRRRSSFCDSWKRRISPASFPRLANGFASKNPRRVMKFDGTYLTRVGISQ